MAVTLTHCSPSRVGLASLRATRVSISCLSSWFALRYPLTSETVLEGMGGALMTFTFQPVSFLRSARSCPSFPTTSLGLMASMMASPVSSMKLMSKISADSGIMARIFSSTLLASSRSDGSGLMSTLRWMFWASMRATESFCEYFS